MKYRRIKLSGFRPFMNYSHNDIEIKNLDKFSIIGVFGENGVGKSTFLNELSVFINPTLYVGKNAYKEVEFEYNKNIYICVMKPMQKHYQIFKNGELVKDTQKGNITQYLEYVDRYLNINKNIEFFFRIGAKQPGVPGLSPSERKKSFLDINPVLSKIFDMYKNNIKPVNTKYKYEMNALLNNLTKSRSMDDIEAQLRLAEQDQKKQETNYTDVITSINDCKNNINNSKDKIDTIIKTADLGTGYSDNLDINAIKNELLEAKSKYNITDIKSVLEIVKDYSETGNINNAIQNINDNINQISPKIEDDSKILKQHDEESTLLQISNTESTVNNLSNRLQKLSNDININNLALKVNLDELSNIDVSNCKKLVTDISTYFIEDINSDRIVNINNINIDEEKLNLTKASKLIDNLTMKQSRILESKKLVKYLDNSHCNDDNCEYRSKLEELRGDDSLNDIIVKARINKAYLDRSIADYEYSKSKMFILDELVSKIRSSNVLRLLNKYSELNKEYLLNMLEESSFNDVIHYIEDIKLYIKKIYDVKLQINEYNDTLEKLQLANNSLSALRGNINNNMYNSIKNRYIENKTIYNELTKNLSILQPVKENTLLFKVVNKKLESLYLYENDLLSNQSIIRDSNNKIVELNSKLSSLIQDKRNLTTSIENLKTELYIVKSVNSGIDNLKENIDVYKQLDNLFDPKKGISVILLQKLTQNLKDITNDILQKTFENDCALEIDISVDDTKFNIDVIKNGYYQGDAKSAASDGETDLIKLAIHIAFCLLLRQNKTFLNVLVFDEIDAFLDVGRNKARFARIIPYITNILNFNQIFTISHNNHLLTDNLGLILLPGYSLDNINENNIIYKMK